MGEWHGDEDEISFCYYERMRLKEEADVEAYLSEHEDE